MDQRFGNTWTLNLSEKIAVKMTIYFNQPAENTIRTIQSLTATSH